MFKGSLSSIGVAAFGAIAASGLTIAPANAAVLTSSGIFTNVDPASVDGEDMSLIEWGTPFGGTQRSGYEFIGISEPGFDLDPLLAPLIAAGEGTTAPFLLGEFTHFNFPITGATLNTTDLVIGADFDGVMASITASFDHNETPNSGVCQFPGSPPCPDAVTITNIATATTNVVIDGMQYDLTIEGFSHSEGGPILDEFVTNENAENTAGLFATLTKVPGQTTESVPEPGLVVGLLAVSGLGLGLKRKK